MRLYTKLFFLFFLLSSLSCVTTHPGLETSVKQETKAPLLNSERIKQKFGSYGVHVIPLIPEQSSRRVSSLYSTHEGKEITRTLAVTLFADPMDSALSEEHRQITGDGKSIGSTFKERGWAIEKRNVYMGNADKVPAYVYALMHVEQQPLATHIYKMHVKKDGQSHFYATIAEFHHPDYLRLHDVKEIYGNIEDTAEGDWTLHQILQSMQ